MCVCELDCEVYLELLPPGCHECMWYASLEFVIQHGVYAVAQNLPFVLLSIDIMLPWKELSLSLRSCSKGPFFIALDLPLPPFNWLLKQCLNYSTISLFDLCLPLFNFSLRLSLRIRNPLVLSSTSLKDLF